jgi:molybdopterin molybdotransferase
MTQAAKLLDDCFAHDKKRLLHDEAIRILQERVSPVAARQSVKVSQAAGRTLANAVAASFPIPAFDNAAVDGFSFAAVDYEPNGGIEMPVEGRAAAGHHVPEPP